MTLPGVGEFLAQANSSSGSKKIIPAATYDGIKDMDVAKQKSGKSGSK